METSSDKHFQKCVPPCQRFLTPDDTHKMCVICLGEDHACSVSEGAECAACENFSIRKHCSCLSLFSRELGRASAPSGSGAWWRSWSSQVELEEDFERGIFLSHSSAADAGDLLDVDVLSLVSSDPADSALLDASLEEQDVVVEDKNETLEPSLPACPAYSELSDVMVLVTERLNLPWKHEKPKTAHGRLDQRFLAGHDLPVCKLCAHGGIARARIYIDASHRRDIGKLSFNRRNIDVEDSDPIVEASENDI